MYHESYSVNTLVSNNSVNCINNYAHSSVKDNGDTNTDVAVLIKTKSRNIKDFTSDEISKGSVAVILVWDDLPSQR